MDKRQEGTGQWFLKSSEFIAWVKGSTPTLLCPGIPGAGKTFMTAIVVNSLLDRFSKVDDVGVVVFYCSYSMREEQTKEKLLAGLLRQLVKPKHSESDRVQALYELCKNAKRRPSFSELSGLLQHVAGTYSKMFIVIDALDECESKDWSPLITELRRLQTQLPALRLMVTFRQHVKITEEFTDAVTFEIRAHSWDLEHYIKGHMPRLSKHVEETAGLREEVIEAIVKAADGM
jgi:Cdc6-like AAA superfamily ATPase